MADDGMMQQVARELNFVSMEPGAAAHATGVMAINHLVAEAALKRIGVDRPQLSLETLKAHAAEAAKRT